MLESSFEYGGLPVIVAYGLNKEHISQAEAYKVYGRKRVSFLVKECKLVPMKQGRRTFFDKAKLDRFAFINRLTYGVERKTLVDTDKTAEKSGK